MATIVGQKTRRGQTQTSKMPTKNQNQNQNQKNIMEGNQKISEDEAQARNKEKTINSDATEQTENDKNIQKTQDQKLIAHGKESLKKSIDELEKSNKILASAGNKTFEVSNKAAIALVASGKNTGVDLANKMDKNKVSPSVLTDLAAMKTTGKIKSGEYMSLAALIAWVMLILIKLEKKTADSSLKAQLVQAKAEINLVAESAKNMIASANKKAVAGYMSAAASAFETFASGVMQLGTVSSVLTGVGLVLVATAGKAGATFLELKSALANITADVQKSAAGEISQEAGNEQQKFNALLGSLVEILGSLVQQYSAIINALNS